MRYPPTASALGRRIGEALRRKLDFEPVELLAT